MMNNTEQQSTGENQRLDDKHRDTENTEENMSEQTCPACGVEYTEHLGLVGTCYRLQEAINTVENLERKLDEKDEALTAAYLCGAADYKAQARILREALERIYALTHAFDDQNKYAAVLSGIAADALQRAGGK